jgi:hypothetical protein
MPQVISIDYFVIIIAITVIDNADSQALPDKNGAQEKCGRRD